MMSGAQVRALRGGRGLTQQDAARRWKMSQTYLSLVEGGKRRVPARLVRLLARDESRLATALPFGRSLPRPDDLPGLLGVLGYPGFAYLAARRKAANPAEVVLAALEGEGVPARVVEALPWVFVTFPELDWDWLLTHAKLANLQNRLGYLVTLALQRAVQRGDAVVVRTLGDVERTLEDARLAKEDTLGRELTNVERRHLREHRPAAAAHWNVLTSLRAEDLRHVP